jgi:hypothetical protein
MIWNEYFWMQFSNLLNNGLEHFVTFTDRENTVVSD